MFIRHLLMESRENETSSARFSHSSSSGRANLKIKPIYQLVMLITTSRLRQLTDYYAVMEGSQYGFRTHRGVQIVVQRTEPKVIR